jgi:GntR family transcriptional regulator
MPNPGDRFTPRYFAIEQSLRARIATLQPHDPLPSDADLCAEFGVSRMTARTAVQQLVQDGLVYRESGRGTFVAAPIVDRQLSNLRGFTTEMIARGLHPSSTLLEAQLVTGSQAQTQALSVPAGSKVVSIRRVRRGDGVPLVLDRTILTERCAGVLDADLESGSMHEALIALGIVPTRGTSAVTAELATDHDAEHLSIKRRSPLLVERRLIRDGTGVATEWTESRYVPERYSITAQFTVELPPSPN